MEETSAGAVIFRKKNNTIMFLLLHYPSGHWDFVKGKMESEETPLQTVIREAKEETGIVDLEFVKNFEEVIKYNFQFEGTLINKSVIFFLAETKTEEITLSHEHLDFTWLSFDGAIKKITYENAQRVLKNANKLLANTL